jgi:hypothetical protein
MSTEDGSISVRPGVVCFGFRMHLYANYCFYVYYGIVRVFGSPV